MYILTSATGSAADAFKNPLYICGRTPSYPGKDSTWSWMGAADVVAARRVVVIASLMNMMIQMIKNVLWVLGSTEEEKSALIFLIWDGMEVDLVLGTDP